MTPRQILGQYMTPVWFAEAVVARYFPDLGAADLVLEPSCGAGAFLQALPAHVRALGVEVDPVLAERARLETGRPVICGDFRSVALDIEPTAIIGNPPFRVDLIHGFLDRAQHLLPEGGRAGFVLPAFAFQTARTFCRMAARWSIAQEMIPRNVFHRLTTPLVFATFTKERERVLVGFALYQEADAVLSMPREYREALAAGPGIWRRLVRVALARLGGRAHLPEIYAEVEGKRPGAGEFWREKVRQTLRVYPRDFEPLGNGRYLLRSAA